MKEKDYLALLAKREIQPTAIRILVLQAMLKAGRSVSLLDLENMLDTIDKSSIFRTITLFLSHHLYTASMTGQVLSNMRYAVQAALAKSTTCTLIFIARVATRHSASRISRHR